MEKKHQQEEYVDFVVTARKYKTLLTAKYKSRPMWHKPSAGDVVSHLPGTIIKIMVEEGQAVEAGQLLLIHEAMKMQNRVVAPISGVAGKHKPPPLPQNPTLTREDGRDQ